MEYVCHRKGLAKIQEVRRYNWVERESSPVPLRAELVELMNQMGRCQASCEGERIVTLIEYAADT